MDEAEDIYMEVMTRLWENRDAFPETAQLPSYLLTAVKNRALNSLRQQSIRSDAGQRLNEHQLREIQFRLTSLEACEPTELFTNEIRQIIESTLQEMPDHTRQIFFRSRFEGKSNKEIAEELAINIKTVEYHIRKALKVFRANLRDYLPTLLAVLSPALPFISV